MKRGKKIGILSGVLCCISLAAFGVSRYEEQKERIKNSDEIIMEVAGEDVKTLSWECSTGSFAFHRDENGAWIYDADEAFPVEKARIEELLEPFREFGVSFVIEEVEDWEQYGLNDPVCTIRMETEGEAYEILLGNYSTMDSQRYVSIGDGRAYLVKNDPLESFEVEISDVIRHDRIPGLEDVVQLQSSGMESERVFYEEDSTSTYYAGDVYFMEREEGNRPLDTARVNEYLDTVRGLNLKDYVEYNAGEEELSRYGLDVPEFSLSIDYIAVEEGTEEEREENFVLNISRDPAWQEEKEAEGEETADEEETAEGDVTAYARVGDSKIIYQITSEQYGRLMELSYDSLRHQELFWADFSDLYQLDILLESETYSITSEMEEEKRTYYYQGEELELASIRSAVRGLKAESFTDEEPVQKEEISLTLYLENDNYPEVRIQLYRYDGKDCIAVVNGEPTALVARASVVDLMEAVNSIVLD